MILGNANLLNSYHNTNQHHGILAPSNLTNGRLINKAFESSKILDSSSSDSLTISSSVGTHTSPHTKSSEPQNGEQLTTSPSPYSSSNSPLSSLSPAEQGSQLSLLSPTNGTSTANTSFATTVELTANLTLQNNDVIEDNVSVYNNKHVSTSDHKNTTQFRLSYCSAVDNSSFMAMPSLEPKYSKENLCEEFENNIVGDNTDSMFELDYSLDQMEQYLQTLPLDELKRISTIQHEEILVRYRQLLRNPELQNIINKAIKVQKGNDKTMVNKCRTPISLPSQNWGKEVRSWIPARNVNVNDLLLKLKELNVQLAHVKNKKVLTNTNATMVSSPLKTNMKNNFCDQHEILKTKNQSHMRYPVPDIEALKELYKSKEKIYIKQNEKISQHQRFLLQLQTELSGLVKKLEKTSKQVYDTEILASQPSKQTNLDITACRSHIDNSYQSSLITSKDPNLANSNKTIDNTNNSVKGLPNTFAINNLSIENPVKTIEASSDINKISQQLINLTTKEPIATELHEISPDQQLKTVIYKEETKDLDSNRLNTSINSFTISPVVTASYFPTPDSGVNENKLEDKISNCESCHENDYTKSDKTQFNQCDNAKHLRHIDENNFEKLIENLPKITTTTVPNFTNLTMSRMEKFHFNPHSVKSVRRRHSYAEPEPYILESQLLTNNAPFIITTSTDFQLQKEQPTDPNLCNTTFKPTMMFNKSPTPLSSYADIIKGKCNNSHNFSPIMESDNKYKTLNATKDFDVSQFDNFSKDIILNDQTDNRQNRYETSQIMMNTIYTSNAVENGKNNLNFTKLYTDNMDKTTDDNINKDVTVTWDSQEKSMKQNGDEIKETYKINQCNFDAILSPISLNNVEYSDSNSKSIIYTESQNSASSLHLNDNKNDKSNNIQNHTRESLNSPLNSIFTNLDDYEATSYISDEPFKIPRSTLLLTALVDHNVQSTLSHPTTSFSTDNLISNQSQSQSSLSDNKPDGSSSPENNFSFNDTILQIEPISPDPKLKSCLKKGGTSTQSKKSSNLTTFSTTNIGVMSPCRRVSFDPLALLLDAALEGEYDLVVSSANKAENPSASNDEGITALHNAICAGHIDIVTFLIEFGCDINASDSDGWTPLHCAASCNNLTMVKLLVRNGASPYATTISDQETPLQKCDYLPQHPFIFGETTNNPQYLSLNNVVGNGNGTTNFEKTVSAVVNDILRLFSQNTDEHGQGDLEQKLEFILDTKTNTCATYICVIQNIMGLVWNGRVYALYYYDAENEDELSFICGQELYILAISPTLHPDNKNVSSPTHKRENQNDLFKNMKNNILLTQDWWLAKDLNGNMGLVPRNYIGLYKRVVGSLS